MGDRINPFVTQSADSLPQTHVKVPYLQIQFYRVLYEDTRLRHRTRESAMESGVKPRVEFDANTARSLVAAGQLLKVHHCERSGQLLGTLL